MAEKTFTCPVPECRNTFTLPAEKAGETQVCNGLNVKANSEGQALTRDARTGELRPITQDGETFIFIGMNGEEFDPLRFGIGVKGVHHHSPTVMEGSLHYEEHHAGGGVAMEAVKAVEEGRS